MDIFKRGATDKRLRAAADALERSGKVLGDLAADPAGASAFFAPVKASLAAARCAPGAERGSAAIAAAEDLTHLLEKVFMEMLLFKTPQDAAIKEALFLLQEACALTPRLMFGKADAAAGIRARSAAARKALAGALTAAGNAPEEFAQNLKFSSIYSGLDAVFDALERCAETLQEFP
jgi:hypothetical protein